MPTSYMPSLSGMSSLCVVHSAVHVIAVIAPPQTSKNQRNVGNEDVTMNPAPFEATVKREPSAALHQIRMDLGRSSGVLSP